MSSRLRLFPLLLLICVPVGPAAQRAEPGLTQSDAFVRKMGIVLLRGAEPAAPADGPLQTRFSEAELNAWLTHGGRELLPAGVSGAALKLLGAGMLEGTATVDLERVAKDRGATGGPWSYLSGQVPVMVSGVLRTESGTGRFQVQSASVSGIPVPAPLLEDLLAYYYGQSADGPRIGLDDPFPLPARIRRIEVGQGQAVVIQ